MEAAVNAPDIDCPSCAGCDPSCGCCHGTGRVSPATADWWRSEGMAVGRKFAVTKTCPECPWRKDVETGRFPPERFATLKRTCEQGFGNPVFACHKSRMDDERACAGFLLVEGDNNFAVRLAVLRGDFDPRRVEATGPLFKSYEAMAEANGLSRRRAKRKDEVPRGVRSDAGEE